MPRKNFFYRPSGYYFRKALRAAASQAEAETLCLKVIDEHELLREWCREHGMIPPKWFITPDERAAKAAQPGSVSLFPTTAAPSEPAS